MAEAAQAAQARLVKYSSKNYKQRYGLTAQEVGELVAQQGGQCAICGDHFSEVGKKRACIDHDHETKKIRSVLCAECNIGLGKFQDNVGLLLAAIDYLNEHE